MNDGMKEIIVKSNDSEITIPIYEVRNQSILTDVDLAKLYNFKEGSKFIHKMVEENKELFSDECYFELNDKEKDFIFNGSKLERNSEDVSTSYAFTKYGIAKIALLLNSDTNVLCVSFIIMGTLLCLNNSKVVRTSED